MNTTHSFYFIEHYERLRDKLQEIIQEQYILDHPQLVIEICDLVNDDILADPAEPRDYEAWGWYKQMVEAQAYHIELVLEIWDKGFYPKSYIFLEELKEVLDQLEEKIAWDSGFTGL